MYLKYGGCMKYIDKKEIKTELSPVYRWESELIISLCLMGDPRKYIFRDIESFLDQDKNLAYEIVNNDHNKNFRINNIVDECDLCEKSTNREEELLIINKLDDKKYFLCLHMELCVENILKDVERIINRFSCDIFKERFHKLFLLCEHINVMDILCLIWEYFTKDITI
jgi:hypothetical protein